MIHVGFISTMGRLRQVDPAQVASLAASIKEVGLINPITVYAREIIRNGQTVAGYGLVAGAHRLEACKALGWLNIPAVVVDLDEHTRIIAECDENLCGPKLTASEQAMFTAKRKAAYIAKHPETAHGGDRKSSSQVGDLNHAPRFTADTAAKTGRSETSVQRDAERGEKVTTAALAMVKGTVLDTGAFLDNLKKVPADKQCEHVKRELQKAQKPKHKPQDAARKSKIDSDVKSRAAKEVAEMLAEHVPGDWWDALKANLYAAGATGIAHEFTNITGQSVMGEAWQ